MSHRYSSSLVSTATPDCHWYHIQLWLYLWQRQICSHRFVEVDNWSPQAYVIHSRRDQCIFIVNEIVLSYLLISSRSFPKPTTSHGSSASSESEAGFLTPSHCLDAPTCHHQFPTHQHESDQDPDRHNDVITLWLRFLSLPMPNFHEIRLRSTNFFRVDFKFAVHFFIWTLYMDQNNITYPIS
jgi:hypothetical protein